MGIIDLEKPTTNPEDEQAYQLRHGMKMVLEDRIQRSNIEDSIDPLFDTLTVINSQYAPNFKVSFVVEGAMVIDSSLYTRQDGLILIRENDTILFAIYRDRATNYLVLRCQSYELMRSDEKRFHDQMNELLHDK